MGAVFGIVAMVVALIGLLVALGHVGYLAMLKSAAQKRGIAGASTAEYVKSRWPVAGGAAAVAALGLILTSGGSVPIDVVGMVLGVGGGVVAKQALDTTRTRYRSQP